MPYPYVVIRYIPGVYGQHSVQFVDPGKAYPDSEKFIVSCSLPFVDGNLTLEAKEALIKAVLTESRKSRFKMCIVFGESDCVYCDPDGTSKESNDPPHGGIKEIQFPLHSAPSPNNTDKTDLATKNQNTEPCCDEIINLLKKYAQDPSSHEKVVETLLGEGCRCEKAGDFEKALKFYESSMAYETKNEKHRYFRFNNLAFCLNLFGRFEEAEGYLRQAIEISPERYNAWKNLGVSLEHQYQIEEAAECYRQAALLSSGESRSVLHLWRLIQKYPALKNIAELGDFT